jgi:hypothetical protein
MAVIAATMCASERSRTSAAAHPLNGTFTGSGGDCYRIARGGPASQVVRSGRYPSSHQNGAGSGLSCAWCCRGDGHSGGVDLVVPVDVPAGPGDDGAHIDVVIGRHLGQVIAPLLKQQRIGCLPAPRPPPR